MAGGVFGAEGGVGEGVLRELGAGFGEEFESYLGEDVGGVDGFGVGEGGEGFGGCRGGGGCVVGYWDCVFGGGAGFGFLGARLRGEGGRWCGGRGD